MDAEMDDSPNPKFWLEFRTFAENWHTSKETKKQSTSPEFAQFAQFAQFALLPAELRLKIWGYLVQPRVVVMCCLDRDDEQLAQKREELRQRTAQGVDNTPVLLRISHEARTVGLRFYELAFSWRISKFFSDTPMARPARVWFNFDLDALYFTGVLEMFDASGVNSPSAYALSKVDTGRVRHIACAFSGLGYPELESDQIFGCLWHVADKFRAAKRLLLVLTEEDETKYKTAMGQGRVVREGISEGCRFLTADNVMQKIWDGWMGGVKGMKNTEEMVDKQMVLVKEESLVDVISGRLNYKLEAKS